MQPSAKPAEVAEIALSELTSLQSDERLLVVADETALADKPDVVAALLGLGRQKGADATLAAMRDVMDGTNALPPTVAAAMGEADVVIPVTDTTTSPAVHNETTERLREEGSIRTLAMCMRPHDVVTGPRVLAADFEEMERISRVMYDLVSSGSEVRVTSELGTELTASIDGMPSQRHRKIPDPGGFSAITWGEVFQAPAVGTMEGTAIVDGPVLNHGWPSSPLEVEISGGEVESITGDADIAPAISRLMADNENGRNVAELSFGINPDVDGKPVVNIWKQKLGTLHFAIGNGLIYGQPVDSPIHVDFVLNSPSVAIDGTPLLEDGSLALEY